MKRLMMGLVLLIATSAVTQAATLRTEILAEKLNFPWSVAELPEGGFLVTERSGQLVFISESGNKRTVELDLPDLYVAAQAGLFEVLLAPDFMTTRELVLSYSCGTERANNTCVVRGILSPQPPYSLLNTQNIFTALPKKEGAAHYGARMTWLPDATLLIALGDGFVYREQAQKLDNHLGKIVRVTRNGEAPDDNPFNHSQAPEIFSYGHRNVQGLIYDAARDAIWQHEHGPKGGDELNKIVKGGNYGWPIATFGIDYTGAKVSPFRELPGVKPPLYLWTPSLAPAGLALYKGDLLVTHLAGKRLQRLRLVDDQWQLEGEYLQDINARLRAVYVAPSGRILVLTDSAEGQLLEVFFED
ncbi:PQQ-dependent sugar dehydrogenase [Pseudidiomarina marina]|uniref:Glucose dehydrogenase n=1 Tax=Pseudidiomarina marina TaxID=502366 RepID=A0A432YGP5_9GAMM|nr:PQQ-dependent sugar dehydrogenase [Pseudidiomarina marina]RUO60100.1 glucose dehydrogenase [Pseudidiomarina marina]